MQATPRNKYLRVKGWGRFTRRVRGHSTARKHLEIHPYSILPDKPAGPGKSVFKCLSTLTGKFPLVVP